MADTFTPAGTAFAIVSPCSQCKNQRAEMSEDGKPFCPRRKWMQDIKTAQDPANKNTSPVTPGSGILGLFGTEGTANEGDNSLHNPIYHDNGRMVLVWIATTRDNSGIRDANDQKIAPNLLDPSFVPDHTDWIHCRPLPYIPAQHEAAYRTSGGLKEGDQLVVITTRDQQQESTDLPNPNTNSLQYNSVQIEGVVMKTNFVFRTPRSKVEVDHTVSGT